MYSYQHRYHAGNKADLHKHLALLAILKILQTKEKSFCVLDAFAGEGIYDLNSPESQQNKEYLQGFDKIQKSLDNSPQLVKELLELTKNYQTADQKLIYPGSPAIIHSKLRQQDQAIFIENHPQAYLQLKKHFSKKSQIHIHKRDGIQAINALTPFKENRGLIFIDPSYEVKGEYNLIISAIQKTHAKFSQGIYMVWYPLLGAAWHLTLSRELHNYFKDKIWQHEWQFCNNNTKGLNGSGIIIINPPWQFDTLIQENLQFLFKVM